MLVVRKQKTDRQDAQLILKLMLKDDFPRIWVPSWENRDLRQLPWHRHRMVQARSRIMSQLQAVALNEGLRCKKRLWRTKRPQLESFQLAPWASRRRRDLLELLDRLNPTIAELSQEVERCPEAQRLATHPGVGALTAMALVLIIGKAECFRCGKQVASYLGLVPLEDSSGTATAGTHHQARKFDVALSAGRVGAGYSAQSSRMAQPILSPDDAAGTQDRQGCHGAAAGDLSVLGAAPGMGLSAVGQVRFVRGTARK